MWDFPIFWPMGGLEMKRNRYTEQQIILILKGLEAGDSVPDIARRHGVAENTGYRWKSKFGGMEVSEVNLLRELEAENAKLKRLVGEAELGKAALKELVEGTW
jgi:putative transposase